MHWKDQSQQSIFSFVAVCMELIVIVELLTFQVSRGALYGSCALNGPDHTRY
jgi:hypothetical protein